MMKVHTQFFNTSPFFHTIIAGLTLPWKKKMALPQKDTRLTVSDPGLMGPFAPSPGIQSLVTCTCYHRIYRCNNGYRWSTGYLPLDRSCSSV